MGVGFRQQNLALELVRTTEAAALADQLKPQSEGQQPETMDTIAAAYAAAGRFDEAITVAQDAVKRARVAKKDALAAEIQSHLALYRQRLPFHETPPATAH